LLHDTIIATAAIKTNNFFMIKLFLLIIVVIA